VEILLFFSFKKIKDWNGKLEKAPENLCSFANKKFFYD
jgi:hypothetical protein